MTFLYSALTMFEDLAGLNSFFSAATVLEFSKWKRIQDDGQYRALVTVRIVEIYIFFLRILYVQNLKESCPSAVLNTCRWK